ncbi:hypothetical protein [Microlunatus speluncae]|uniref:hypothetical protein n=1 Tax=Microlunatus speluncae TaxID=2594267 RepID=UPI0013758994|nr:hypothetical protein [Microlunatus speluncae]
MTKINKFTAALRSYHDHEPPIGIQESLGTTTVDEEVTPPDQDQMISLDAVQVISDATA